MSLLSVLGVAPKAEAWAVPSKRLLGLFTGPDVAFFDEAEARRHARGGRVTPIVFAPDSDDEEQIELGGPLNPAGTARPFGCGPVTGGTPGPFGARLGGGWGQTWEDDE